MIVTAAVGSPMAVEVARFQYIRDRLLRSTTIGRLFLDRLAQQYYRFSPRVAEDIAEDPDLRSALNRLLVVPLLDWFALLETHSRGRTLDLEPLVDGTLNRTQDASGSSWDPQAVKVALLSLKKHLDEKRDDVPTAIAGAPIRDVNATCQYLARQIQAHGGAGTELTWAIVDPLLIYWSARASLQIRSITCVSRRLVSALDRWLGAIPIPHSFCTLPQIVVAQDLDHLSRTIWSPYRVKARIGSQLLRRFAPVVPYDLRKLLRGLGYLRTDRISLGT